MPTPFQHLIYAQRILETTDLPSVVSHPLRAEWGAFLLGSTAGDVQVITGQPRVATHFYRLSEPHEHSAAERFLMACPELVNPEQLSPAHAAFVSGYLVHLVWDEIWARDIFIPCYRDGPLGAEHLAYHLHHNALRVHLDWEAYEQLRSVPHLVPALCGVTPDGWLPFATSSALLAWRDWLVEQLVDPTKIQTSKVFAERMKVSIEALETVVAEIDAGVYGQLPNLVSSLVDYEAAASAECVATLLRYWGIGLDLSRWPKGLT